MKPSKSGKWNEPFVEGVTRNNSVRRFRRKPRDDDGVLRATDNLDVRWRSGNCKYNDRLL
jgi:hypothetical protein